MKNITLRTTVALMVMIVLLSSLGGCNLKSDVSGEGVDAYDNSVDYSRLADLPVYVNSLEECTDPKASYVLPDGKLWRTVTVTEEKGEFTNLIPLSVDTEGNIVGLIRDHRYNSEDLLVERPDAHATGFISVSTGDTVRFDGLAFRNEALGEITPGGIYLRFYDKDFSELIAISPYSMADHLERVADNAEYDELGNLIAFTVNNEYDVAYIRIAFAIEDSQEPVITVNEEIWVPCESYEALRPEKRQYIPAGWHGEVLSVAERLNSMSGLSDDTAVRFAFTSDIHLEPTSKNYEFIRNIGKVTAGVMQSCSVPYLMVTGDSTTQSPAYTTDDLQPNMERVLAILSPVPQENLLLTVGNHDGATGQVEKDGEILNYRYQLNNKERVATYFEWQRSNIRKRFSDDGSYYYIDDVKTKTRFIMINSFWNDFEGEEDGFTTDVNRSFFHNPIFGEEQLLWFANVALDMPEGFSAVIGTHNISVAEDKQAFFDIIKAYNDKSVCNTGHESEMDFRSSSVSADFSEESGEIIAVFQGHNHADMTNTQILGIPCITITTAGADIRDTDPEDRIKGTETETAIDIVTIDKTARKIYLTRLGVGKDREISY